VGRLIEQAGAIAVRGRGDQAEVVLVRARRSPAWIFPKGHIDAGETAAQAAVRELLEEAGVVGEAVAPVGSSRFSSGAEQIEVAYYLVRVLGLGIAAEQREVRWCRFIDARARLTYADSRRLLEDAWALL